MHAQQNTVQNPLVLLTEENGYKIYNTTEAYTSDLNISRGIEISRYSILNSNPIDSSIKRRINRA
jgi:hypothetical protein